MDTWCVSIDTRYVTMDTWCVSIDYGYLVCEYRYLVCDWIPVCGLGIPGV